MKRLFYPAALCLLSLFAQLFAGTAEGTVTDIDGIPIIAASVVNSKGVTSFTDEQGRFSISFERKKDLVTISAGGYLSRSAEVNDGGETAVELEKPRASGEPLPAVVLVTLLGADGMPIPGQAVSNDGTAETDPFGQVSLTPSDSMNVVLIAEGYRDSVVKVFPETGKIQNLTVKLKPTAEKKALFAAITGEVHDEAGKPVRGAAVSCINTDYSAVTDSAGSFVIESVKPGRYSLMAAVWGYDASIINGVVLNEGDRVKRVFMMTHQSAANAEHASAEGRVTDAKGNPVPDAEVLIPAKGRRAVTDSAGVFRFDSLESGVCTITAWAPGYDTARALDVDLWGGETVRSDMRLSEKSEAPAVEAGKGVLVGVVVSSETSGPLGGSQLILKGKNTKTALTGSDGSFTVQALPGIYTLTVISEDHETKVIENVPVVLGQSGRYDVVMDKKGVSAMAKMTIRGVAVKSSGAALLKERQQTFEVVDAVAAEEFSKTGAGSAAEAMKQVTGATIVDDKYVIVRGLPAKYSLVTLNETMIASSDPDENAVQMDIFPTGVIENIRVYKTFQAVRPASFAGGIIDIGTKPFPESKKLTFSAGAGFHSLTTGKSFSTSENGRRFWLGTDDGTRELPKIFRENSKEEIEKHTIVYGKNLNRPDLADSITDHLPFVDEMASSLSSEMWSHTKTAAPNGDFSASYGNSHQFGGQKLGYNASLTYKNDRKLKPGSIQKSYVVDDSVGPMRLTKDFSVDDSKERVLWSVLANTAYEPAKDQRITADYLYLRSAENKIKTVKGAYPASDFPLAEFQTSRLHYIERAMNYIKSSGTHRINTRRDHFTVEWNGSFTRSKQDEPDKRDIYSFKDTTRSEDNPDVPVTNWWMMTTMSAPSHSWRSVNSTMGTANIQAVIPFRQWSGDSAAVTAGAAWNGERQEQRNRRIAYKFPGGFAPTPAWERITDSVMGVLEVDKKESASGYKWGLTVSDDSRDAAQRDGNTQVFAQFAQLELPLFSRLSATLGVRGEKSKMYDETIAASKRTDSSAAKMDSYDILPAAMLTWKPTEKMVVKSAYGKTVIRPSIREKAEYMTESFTGGGAFVGNRKVERSLIDNADIRWELFPRAGDLFAVGTFFKNIQKPIETKFLDNDQKMPANSSSNANILGAELEIVRKLDFIPALDGLSFSGNAALVWSRVKLDSASRKQQNYFPEIGEDRIDNADKELFKNITEHRLYRPFQGQSPFVINAFLSYSAKKAGLTSTVYYNVFGKRLAELTDQIEPYLWELPEHLLNASVTKEIGKSLKVTFRAKNLLNPTKKLVYYKVENNDADPLLEVKEYLKSSTKSGLDFSLGISGSFPPKQ